MIDIHAHYIPLIDDGCDSVESSLSMLEEALHNGVTDIICTPHYREPFLSSYNEVKKKFDELKSVVKEKGININLYLGREVYCVKSLKNLLLSDNFSMCDKKYVMIEFSSNNSDDIAQIVYELKLNGYLPIIAHIERYHNVSLDDAIDAKEAGALIQINASSLFGKDKKFFKKKVKALLKENIVDFVASDIHEDRVNYMKKAYQYISKKYGKEYANKIFFDNAEKIIKS